MCQQHMKVERVDAGSSFYGLAEDIELKKNYIESIWIYYSLRTFEFTTQ